MRPYRELVHACSRGGTFKYWLGKEDVVSVWERLAVRYGVVKRNEAMLTMEIESERFILRSTHLANPITVIRKRRCTADDVRELHGVLGFEEEENAHE